MIIIPVKDGESIDRALKKFKRNSIWLVHEATQSCREFTKSVELRNLKSSC